MVCGVGFDGGSNASKRRGGVPENRGRNLAEMQGTGVVVSH